MSRHPLFGLGLAMIGTLILTPDALLMRWSGMTGFQMTGWRGILMGSVMIAIWALTSRDRAGDLRQLKTRDGRLLVLCQVFNSMLFCLGIALAPVALVLLGVAVVPIFAALLSWVLIREPTHVATWVAMVAVLGGIGIAVIGGDATGVALDQKALIGAGFGLGVAFVLALNFTVIRARPRLPILLVIGCGALVAGCIGTVITGPTRMTEGQVWAMLVTGGLVLPASFFLLSLAARYTNASNVSLIMLMETVLGPFWVWLGVGETPTVAMLVGGAIVVVSLAAYLILTGRNVREKEI